MLKVTQLSGFGGSVTNVIAPAFKSASSYNGSTSSSHSVTMPGTFAAGDLLLAIMVSETGHPVTSMTGWTQIYTSGTNTRRIYRKIAAGSDTATVGLSGSGTLEAAIAAYGATNGIDGTPTTDEASGDTTLSAITVTTAGGFLIVANCLVSAGGATITTPTGFTQDSTTTPSSHLFRFYSKSISASGSTGSVTVDQSGSNTMFSGMVYITPT